MAKIIEFYLCIQMLPAKADFSWATLYVIWNCVTCCQIHEHRIVKVLQ